MDLSDILVCLDATDAGAGRLKLALGLAQAAWLSSDGEIEMPPKTKLEWAFFHLDLAIYDRAKRAAFIVQRGWN